MQKLISVVFLCWLTLGLRAQSDDEKKGLEVPNGIRIGFQLSNLANDDATAANTLSRGYIGYVRKINIIPLLHLETGMEYMIAGAEETEDTRLQLHYLTLPAQGVLKIGPFVAIAGLNANFRLAENLTVNGEKIKRSGSDKSAAFDLAVDAGAGYNIAALTLEARYYWGLLEVENGWYNRNWQLGLKFHF